MKKRVICLLLALLFCFSLASAAAAYGRDTSAEKLLAQDLKSLGLFLGVSETDFDLDRAPSRAEALAMLIRLLGKEGEALKRDLPHPFNDVPAWADPYVGYAYQNGLTNGVSATKFGTENATAEMYLTFVLRALGYSDRNGADFSWNSPFSLAKKVGILPEHVNTVNFWRADVVSVSYAALSAKLKNSGQTLAQKLIAEGVFTQAQYDALLSSVLGLTADLTGSSPFEVHFIDVGQGDASLILCDGRAMLIDGGRSKCSSLIYSYLRDHGVSHLDYIVCTHPDEDHTGGLSGALVYASVGTAFAPVTSADSTSFTNYLKYLDKRGVSLTVPKAGDTFSLGSAKITVLGPVKSYGNDNDSSIVLRVEYGGTSFLFTGDAEYDSEHDILDSGRSIKCDVLKVAHHGSSSSTSYSFLYFAEPQYAVISVGQDNPYGHPHEKVLSRLRDADVKVFRTDLQGTVICRSDGKSVSFFVECNPYGIPSSAPERTAAETPDDAGFVLNISSKVFHRADCGSVKKMSEKNKVFFYGTRDEAVAMGFKPCGTCHP